MVNLGAIIKKYREQSEFTQKDLAIDLEITPTYLSAIENSRKEPSLALIKKICEVINLPEEVLFWESVQIKDGLSKEDRKVIEFAKIIVKNYYENLTTQSV